MVPLQAASLFTVWAAGNGGETLRLWMIGALLWLLSLPLLSGIEGTLIAMMMFEPVRGFLRRAQYLFVGYSDQEPIHLVTPIVTLIAVMVLLRRHRLTQLWATPLAGC